MYKYYSAVFIYPMQLADFKDPKQNRDKVHALWAESHIDYASLFFYFNDDITFKGK